MSGLDFLFSKTLSNPLDFRKVKTPENFEEAFNDFVGFCEKQMPVIQEIDFIPTCFDISDNEETIVFGDKYGNVTIYDAKAKHTNLDVEVCRSGIVTVLLAAANTRILASSLSFEIFFIESKSLSVLRRIQLEPKPISLKLGGGKNLAYISNCSKTLKIIEINSEKELGKPSYFERYIEACDEICCIDVSDDGSLLAFGLSTGVIKLIHGESENELQSTECFSSPASIMSFSQYRRHIGVGFQDFTLKVWLIDSNFTLKYSFAKHTAEITGLAFVRDNRYMISGGKDRSIVMWDMKVERSPYEMNLLGLEVLWFKYSPDHKKLFFNQSRNNYMEWEVPLLTKNARYRKHTDQVNSIHFLPNSFELLSIGDDGLAVIWDYRNDNMQDFIKLEGQLTNVAVSKSGQFVLIASSKPCIYRWNLSSNEPEEYEVSSKVRSIRFSSDENIVAVGDLMNCIIIYDTEVMERKQTIKGHMGPVTDMCFIENDTILITASMDHSLAKWEVGNGNRLGTFHGHNGPVLCMTITPKNWIISGSTDRSIIIWDIDCTLLYNLTVPEFGKNISLFLSADGQFLITLQEDKYYYWKMDNLTVMFQSDTTAQASCLAVSPDELVIAVAEGKTIFVEDNPLKSHSVKIVGKNKGSQHQFMRFILDSVKNNSKGNLKGDHNHWVVAPYLMGMGHILAHTNRVEDLNNCLFNKHNPGCFFTTIKNESPLSLSVDREYKNCIDICLKYLKADYAKKGNKRAYVPLANCLTKLNVIDIPDISRLYDIIFKKSNDSHLPSFCLHETELPALCQSTEFIVKPENIIPSEMYASNGRSIVFYHSLCPMSIDIGTPDSIEFLESLVDCTSDQIFRSKILQALLLDKWDRVKWAVYAQGALYILYMVLLSFYCVLFKQNTWYLVVLLVVHILLFLYEVSQIITDPIDYWKDMWNILDQLRGISFSVYAIMVWGGTDSNDVLLTVIIFSWTRGISYFRMFVGTRYMVRLLTEVLKDMKVFMVILVYSTLAFTYILYIRNMEISFADYLIASYKLDLGDFVTDNETMRIFDWVIFFLVTVINPLIMLNLLISIMGDTYGKVKDSNDIANFQELTEMIIEIEKLMFWKKDSCEKHYLHQCDYLTGTDENSDKIMEKIKVLKTQVGNIESTLKYVKNRVMKTNISEMETNLQMIKKDQEEMMVEFKEILDRNNKLLEDMIAG